MTKESHPANIALISQANHIMRLVDDAVASLDADDYGGLRATLGLIRAQADEISKDAFYGGEDRPTRGPHPFVPSRWPLECEVCGASEEQPQHHAPHGG